MKEVATAFSMLQFLSRPNSMTRGRDFIELMKPRVMSLAVFTALVGLLIAPVHLDLIHQLIALLAIALNFVAAALLAFTIFFYIIVYTFWLKRRTPQNIVIGGAAGALPPVIGWAAATGNIGLEPLILFLIIFLWTPPHFWALCINRSEEYARAGIPMLPVVAGKATTTRQILIYSALLLPISLLSWALGFAGTIYGAVAAICGALFVVLAFRLRGSGGTDRRDASR